MLLVIVQTLLDGAEELRTEWRQTGLALAQTEGKTRERRALAGSFREERGLGLLRVQLGLAWIEEWSPA